MKESLSGKHLTSFADHLNEQYGERGTTTREEFEEGFEAFKLGAMLQELRKEKGMTQIQLAEKCGTTKTYVPRIENVPKHYENYLKKHNESKQRTK